MFLLSLRWFRVEAGSGGLELPTCMSALTMIHFFHRTPLCLLFWKKWTHRYLVGVLLSDQSHIFYSLFCKGGKQNGVNGDVLNRSGTHGNTFAHTAAEGVFLRDTSFNYNILIARFWKSDIKVSWNYDHRKLENATHNLQSSVWLRSSLKPVTYALYIFLFFFFLLIETWIIMGFTNWQFCPLKLGQTGFTTRLLPPMPVYALPPTCS